MEWRCKVYSLTRIVPYDGMGDAGSMCHKVRWDDDKKEGIEIPCDYPEVGWCLKVGSPHARSGQWQDWWRTSPVTEILEETEDEESVLVSFKTGNSTYAWRKFK
jgi:hypothetical protein